MKSALQAIPILALAALLAACQQQEAPPAAPQPVKEAKPAETSEPAKPTAEESYTTPQEGEKQGKMPLEVVDKNISEATGQPSAMPAARGPESVVFETSMGAVSFPHEEHGALVGCTECHGEGEPAALELDQQSAHQLCRGCHEERGAGPTGCRDCHVKGS